jgi:hypothetical protein
MPYKDYCMNNTADIFSKNVEIAFPREKSNKLKRINKQNNTT